jgi:putative toxin-antitoxin system antitoxin component (TIGR02293 family)
MRTASAVLPTVADEPASDASFHARVGALLGLKAALHSDVDLIEVLEKGLPVGAVQALRTRGGLTDEETYALIAPRRTLSRRDTLRQALSREEADKAVRIARVMARAQQVFGGRPEYAAEWLRSPKSALGGRTPMQALASESGARAIEELLIGVEYGLFG